MSEYSKGAANGWNMYPRSVLFVIVCLQIWVPILLLDPLAIYWSRAIEVKLIRIDAIQYIRSLAADGSRIGV